MSLKSLKPKINIHIYKFNHLNTFLNVLVGTNKINDIRFLVVIPVTNTSSFVVKPSRVIDIQTIQKYQPRWSVDVNIYVVSDELPSNECTHQEPDKKRAKHKN